jgi:transposase
MESQALDHRYRTTQDPRLRTRAQMVFLVAEQRLKGPHIAAIVREREATVVRWRKRYLAEGLNGVQDAPRPGRSTQVTAASRSLLRTAVRRRL